MKRTIVLLIIFSITLSSYFLFIKDDSTVDLPIIVDTKYNVLDDGREELLLLFDDNTDRIPSYSTSGLDFFNEIPDFAKSKYQLKIFAVETIESILKSHNNVYGFILIDNGDLVVNDIYYFKEIGYDTIVKSVYLFKSNDKNNDKLLVLMLGNRTAKFIGSGQISLNKIKSININFRDI